MQKNKSVSTVATVCIINRNSLRRITKDVQIVDIIDHVRDVEAAVARWSINPAR